MSIQIPGKIEDGKLKLDSKLLKSFVYRNHKMGKVIVEIKKDVGKRTPAQNNSIHLYCQRNAEEYNERGISMRIVIQKFKEGFDGIWTMVAFKEIVWRNVQMYMLRKKSTTKLDKQGDIDKVVDVITKFNAENFEFSVPFPSIENEDGDIKS